MPIPDRQVIDIGQGPAVVFAHGTAADRTMFAPQLDTLSADRRLIAYDSRGRTSAAFAPYDLHDLARDCRDLLDERGIERCVLAGMSMGGFMGVVFALTYPERLADLVMMSADLAAYPPERLTTVMADFDRLDRLDRDGPVGRDWAEWSMPLCLGATTIRENPALVERFIAGRAALPACAVQIEARSWLAKPDRHADAARIAVPVLIVHGAEDALLPYDRKVPPMLAAFPNAQAARIERAGHFANLERPEAVNAAMAGFLGRIGW
jgi:pimeloyl-ACP methyl ester carboxylesterase